MATRVKQGVSVERAENGGSVRNHKGHEVSFGAGAVVVQGKDGHTTVFDPDVYDALFEESRDESPRWNDQAQ